MINFAFNKERFYRNNSIYKSTNQQFMKPAKMNPQEKIKKSLALKKYFGFLTRIILVLTISAFCFQSINAQVEVKWTKEIQGEILWQEVTALGNLIVGTSDNLLGINPLTGEVNWGKNVFAGLKREAMEELPNSPFIKITTSNSIHIFDQLSGDEVFNSRTAGIKNIEDYFLLYNSDAILVSGKDNGNQPLMLAVKMSEGKVMWSLQEKFGRIIAVNELDNNEVLIVTLFNNYKINIQNGEILWKEASSPEAAQVEKMGALGALMKAAAENMTKDMEFELRFYRPQNSNVFYLGSQKESQSSMTSSSGEPTIIYSNAYYAFNISDGSLVWEKPIEMDGKISHLTFLDDGILIMPDDGNRTKINLFDYQTQEGKWGKKGKGITIKGGIYDFLDTGKGILLVTQTSSRNFLNYLDPSTGTITFDKPVKVDGRVVGIVPLARGILYITTEEMNILDPLTGELKWDKSINTNPELTAEKDGLIYAFDTKTKTLKVVDKSKETVKELSSTEIKFDGGEDPRKIEVMGDGVFIHSDQNVAKFDFNGSLLFQEYYPAPREPGWKRALLYAEAIRGAYVGANAYYVSGAMEAIEDPVRQEDAIAGELVNQIGNAYGELGDKASSYAKEAFKMASARHKATLSARDYMLIMAKQDKVIELLQISKSTGKPINSIDLGKDREPVYAVDDVAGKVYYVVEGNKINCYQL